MLYKVGSFVFYIFFKIFFKFKVVGSENIPLKGAVVIAPNHISNLDPPLVAASSFHIRHINFMAKAELFQNKFVGFVLNKIGAFPVQRGESDRQALKMAMSVLRDKKVLGIFPEGKRSKNGKLQEGSSGAALFALKNNAEVIPVAIKGNYKLFKPLTIVFGNPVNLDEYRKEKITHEDSKEAIKVIMNDIQLLLDDNVN